MLSIPYFCFRFRDTHGLHIGCAKRSWAVRRTFRESVIIMIDEEDQILSLRPFLPGFREGRNDRLA
jgi:hypothetical protein